MCKGFAPGEAAGIANNKFVTLLTINKELDDIDSASIRLAAPTTFPANDVILGSSLKDQYASFSSIYVSSWEVSRPSTNMLYYGLSCTDNNAVKLR